MWAFASNFKQIEGNILWKASLLIVQEEQFISSETFICSLYFIAVHQLDSTLETHVKRGCAHNI